MFTNDTKIFRQILSNDVFMALQEDISELETWSNIWQLGFNADKCHVLTLGKFENNQLAYQYQISGQELEHVDHEKDLGIIIDSELSFAEHISEKARYS